MKSLTVIQNQHVNGMWDNLEVLKSLYDSDFLKQIETVFKDKPKEVWITLAVIMQLEVIDNPKRITLILRKAREFIEGMKESYQKLVDLWRKKIRNN